jgi:hypothetical protein
MKIALFHGYDWIHFEMLGYAIDYCFTKKYQFEVFINEREYVSEEWKNVYNSAFKKQIIWNSISDYNSKNFTYTILLTSVDPNFIADGNGKLVAIRHKIDETFPNVPNIDVRWFDDAAPWAIPVFPGVSRFEKDFHLKNKKISVVLLGARHTQTPTATLRQIFVNFDDIEFHFISRDELDAQPLANTKYYTNINTEYMIDIFKKSHYMFCIDHTNYEYMGSSCAFWMSFSYGCRLILPKKLSHFNLTSPLYYDENSRITLDAPNLDTVFIEAHKIITHRDTVFNSVISPWFLNICERINRFPPSTFVETGTYTGEGIQNALACFNTIHSIELNHTFVEKARDRFKNEKRVYVHHGDSAEVLEQLSNELIGPVLFYLDSHYSGGETAFGKEEDNGCPLLRELSVLGKRNANDIVVIDDMRLMGKTSWAGLENDTVYPLTLYNFEHVTMDAILKAYNKNASVYICNDIDRIVIFV